MKPCCWNQPLLLFAGSSLEVFGEAKLIRERWRDNVKYRDAVERMSDQGVGSGGDRGNSDCGLGCSERAKPMYSWSIEENVKLSYEGNVCWAIATVDELPTPVSKVSSSVLEQIEEVRLWDYLSTQWKRNH